MIDAVALGEVLIDFASTAASLFTEMPGGIPEKDAVLKVM